MVLSQKWKSVYPALHKFHISPFMLYFYLGVFLSRWLTYSLEIFYCSFSQNGNLTFQENILNFFKKEAQWLLETISN